MSGKQQKAEKPKSQKTKENREQISSEINTQTQTSSMTTMSMTEQGSGMLTEKQLRKLEWEKKLAEQGISNKEVKKELSKAELKAKRREQQEIQRQAKQEKNTTTSAKSSSECESQPLKNKTATTDASNIKKSIKSVTEPDPRKSPKRTPELSKIKSKVLSAKCIQLVQHLYKEPKSEYSSKLVNYKDVHPVFVRLGTQYSEKVILGSNARLLGLLAALKYLIDDLQTPPKQEYCRYLEAVLQSCTEYLQHCRPMAVSMTNALRRFKLELSQIDTGLSDNQKRAELQNSVDLYIENHVKKAWDSIIEKVNEKILDGDVILIYGCSSIVLKILLEAHRNNKEFHVIVTDSRPLLEGREMLRRLVVAGIKCTYVLINAISYIMGGVTKVLLGAHALLTNGYVMSRIGTAQVALVAQTYSKPVLVCCETYKFSERVQTDSFVYNEIDNSDLLSSANGTVLKDTLKVNSLNLLYDVTPPDFVSAVVTELAILPCTSVPVVLRIHGNESI